MLRLISSRLPWRAAAASATAAVAYGVSECKSKPDGLTQLRKQDFTLSNHYHGKRSVRVLRVRRDDSHETVQEYNVATRLFSPRYSKVFVEEDNTDLVATDTQKNTVYVVAQRTAAKTPEGFGVELARHLLLEYPMLSAVEVEVTENLWRRVIVPSGEPHEHGFVREAPERSTARVRVTREAPDEPEVISGIAGLTVLKTTQSGFENYLKDKYTMLPDTRERCMATEMDVQWKYTDGMPPDYAKVREAVRSQMMYGFFGPASGGIYSPSLQATIYDAGCLVLKAAPRVASISIFTPNIHMIPFHALKALGGNESKGFQDDVYVATSEPAGTISCTIDRS